MESRCDSQTLDHIFVTGMIVSSTRAPFVRMLRYVLAVSLCNLRRKVL
jgi:hypothetical protein